MNKEFIPYEEALALKALGFSEVCCAYYHSFHGFTFYYADFHTNSNDGTHKDKYETCSAPLYQQAFKWFEKKHNLFILMQVGMNNGECQTFYFNVIKFGKNLYKSLHRSKTSLYSREEAELECLRQLIELTKEKI